MKKLIGLFIGLAFVCGVTSVRALPTTNTQNLVVSVTTLGTGYTCSTGYVALPIMTNSTGGHFLTPPVGATQLTLTDISGFGSPYLSTAVVVRKADSNTWCGTNTVQVSVDGTDQYSCEVEVKHAPNGVTNKETNTLQVVWQ